MTFMDSSRGGKPGLYGSSMGKHGSFTPSFNLKNTSWLTCWLDALKNHFALILTLHPRDFTAHTRDCFAAWLSRNENWLHVSCVITPTNSSLLSQTAPVPIWADRNNICCIFLRAMSYNVTCNVRT